MENSQSNRFYTQKGYQMKAEGAITDTMEDYLEMICRHAATDGYVRVNSLAQKLNVRPSSSSKMVAALKEKGLVAYEKYGVVIPTGEGWELGNYLLWRHDVLNAFFCFINHTPDELEQVERVEHFIHPETVRNIEAFLKGQTK